MGQVSLKDVKNQGHLISNTMHWFSTSSRHNNFLNLYKYYKKIYKCTRNKHFILIFLIDDSFAKEYYST